MDLLLVLIHAALYIVSFLLITLLAGELDIFDTGFFEHFLRVVKLISPGGAGDVVALFHLKSNDHLYPGLDDGAGAISARRMGYINNAAFQ